MKNICFLWRHSAVLEMFERAASVVMYFCPPTRSNLVLRVPCQGRQILVEASWNVMAHAQKPDFVFRRNGRVHLNQRGRQFSRLLAAEVSASAVVMLDTPWSEVVWRVLATHSIRQFLLHFHSRASPCAITFQLESKTTHNNKHYKWLHFEREVVVIKLFYTGPVGYVHCQ